MMSTDMMVKMKYFSLLLIFLVGCNLPYRTVGTCDSCYDNETCQKGEGIFPTHRCLPNRSPFFEYEKINESKINETLKNKSLNWIFNWTSKPANEKVPEDYKQIVIYETVCECISGIFNCNLSMFSQCSCNEYCYNKSKTIWVPGNNCEMPVHCYVAGDII